jgi:glucan phosphoethanolaminetransferase (alkaline phosphatase superfamily)
MTMTERISGMSPSLKARITGLVYVISGVLFGFSENSVRGKLVVWGDAAATAHNILSHEAVYRLAFVAELLPLYVVVTVLLYDLLKPVNKNVSLLAAVFSLVGCTIGTLTSLLHLAPLVILKGSLLPAAFTTDQSQALALMTLKLGAQGTNLMMVFFAFYCALIGCLILRSRFLPRIIGAFLVLAGLAYLTDCFAKFLLLPLANYSFRYIAFPAGVLGEGSLMLWLLVMGLNSQRWEEQARAGLPA